MKYKLFLIIFSILSLYAICSTLYATPTFAQAIACSATGTCPATTGWYCQGNETIEGTGGVCNSTPHPPASSPICDYNYAPIPNNPYGCINGVPAPRCNPPPASPNQCPPTTNQYCQGSQTWQGVDGKCNVPPGFTTGLCQYNYGPYIDLNTKQATNPLGCVNGQASAPNRFQGIFGFIKAPAPVSQIGYGVDAIQRSLNVFVEIIYSLAGLYFVYAILISGWQWLTAGPNKEALDSAKKRITNAVIGLTLMALTFVIIRIFGNILGFDLLSIPLLP